VRERPKKNAPRGRVYMLLVAPQGFRSDENTGDKHVFHIIPHAVPQGMRQGFIPRLRSHLFILLEPYRTIEKLAEGAFQRARMSDTSLKSGPLFRDLFHFFYELLFVLNSQRIGSTVADVDDEVVITARHNAWKNEPLDVGLDELSS
jgi:hypothetical protein